MKRIIAILLSAGAVAIAGCGYTTTSALPPHLKTIYVEPFKNDITYTKTGEQGVYFPLLEVKTHNAVVDRFLFDGNLKLVEAEENADLVIKGDLIEYRRNPLRYADNEDVEEYRVQIVMKLALIDIASGEAMWEYDRFVGEATYFVSGSQATSEDSAVQEATVDIARRIVEATVENW